MFAGTRSPRQSRVQSKTPRPARGWIPGRNRTQPSLAGGMLPGSLHGIRAEGAARSQLVKSQVTVMTSPFQKKNIPAKPGVRSGLRLQSKQRKMQREAGRPVVVAQMPRNKHRKQSVSRCARGLAHRRRLCAGVPACASPIPPNCWRWAARWPGDLWKYYGL